MYELHNSNQNVFNHSLGYFWRHVVLDDPDQPAEYFACWGAYKRVYKPVSLTGMKYEAPEDWFLYLAHQVSKATIDISSEEESYDEM